MLTVDEQKTLDEIEALLASISDDRKLYNRLFYQKGILLSTLAQIMHRDRLLYNEFKQRIDQLKTDVASRH